mmetsp:Transcript_58552/g.128402  ORF Transcript_58552/g.128402 Transcript_58552/m.128402 type:complete len:255 (-) Transcript_58552:359-1123(-)
MTALSNLLMARLCWWDVRATFYEKSLKSKTRRSKNKLNVRSTNATGTILERMGGGPTRRPGTRIGEKAGVMHGTNGKVMNGRSGQRLGPERNRPRNPNPRKRTGSGSKMSGRAGMVTMMSGMNGTSGQRGRNGRRGGRSLKGRASRTSGGTGTLLGSGRSGRSRGGGSLSSLRRKKRLSRPARHLRLLLRPVAPTTTRMSSQRARSPDDPKLRDEVSLVAPWPVLSAAPGPQEERPKAVHRQLLTPRRRASRRI